MKYLQRKGYKIIPVNPKEAGKEIHNELCYASLKDIPINIDMVDVFRKSDECLELAKDTIKIKAKVFWMQIGIFNSEASELKIPICIQKTFALILIVSLANSKHSSLFRKTSTISILIGMSFNDA